MRLGLGSYACAWRIGVPGADPPNPMDACGLIRHAAALGLSVVQMADNLPLERLGGSELQRIREQAVAAGIDVELGTRGIGAPHLRRYLELCTYFGSPILRAVIDTATEHPSPEEVVHQLRPLLPQFERADVLLALENHDRFDARTFAWIVSELGARQVGICLDTVNSFGALEGPEVVIDTLAPYVVNLHLKDFIIRRHPSMMGFEITGAPAGQGRLDVPRLLNTLREQDRDCNAILELWPAPDARIEDTIAREEQWTVASVQYLRTLIPQ
ncbi:MAG TPA: sugar phosphate isomerase/epimerase family protein [Bryobacteraceae bacterium]|nr:sugar phosphate isomerase/epimerase family protein [Bryobacteraceae bacterium]